MASDPSAAASALREFIRSNGKADGSIDAMDALHSLEGAVLDARGAREREEAFSRALVQAQAEVNAAYKDKDVGDRYKVAETEQLLVLCREVMIRHKLALEVGSSEVVVISGSPFLRIHFGLRHESGFVRNTVRDFPIVSKGGGNDVAIRQANTSALGYFLRDAFALPRLKDEGEAAAAAQARSGPRRAATVASAPRQSAPALSEKAQAVVNGIRSAKDAEALDKAENKVADLRIALDGGDEIGYSAAEVAAFEQACAARRAELSGAATGAAS